MLKFYLQLRTFKNDSAARLRAPHGSTEALAFLTLAEEAGYALVHCDTQLRVKRVTPSYAALTGYDEEECVGMRWSMLQGAFISACLTGEHLMIANNDGRLPQERFNRRLQCRGSLFAAPRGTFRLL